MIQCRRTSEAISGSSDVHASECYSVQGSVLRCCLVPVVKGMCPASDHHVRIVLTGGSLTDNMNAVAQYAVSRFVGETSQAYPYLGCVEETRYHQTRWIDAQSLVTRLD